MFSAKVRPSNRNVHNNPISPLNIPAVHIHANVCRWCGKMDSFIIGMGSLDNNFRLVYFCKSYHVYTCHRLNAQQKCLRSVGI